jgi:hypothetical protein
MANCEHKGPVEIMTIAEAWLREQNIADDRWAGIKVRHAENTPGAMWESVVIDIERRGDQWIVTRLDRNRTAVEGPVGLSLV